MKEGPGRYYYLSTNKVYEGEWHQDTAKCGVFRDISELDDGVKPDNFELPEVGAPDDFMLSRAPSFNPCTYSWALRTRRGF